FSSRRRHTRSTRDWSSDVCSSDLLFVAAHPFWIRTTKLMAKLSHLRARRLQADAGFQSSGDRQVVPVIRTIRIRLQRNEQIGRRSEERRVGKECRSWGAQEAKRRI